MAKAKSRKKPARKAARAKAASKPIGRFPNETPAYRKAREKLLKAEIGLRRQVEAVAALRRTLPLGGPVAEDFVFDEQADVVGMRQVRLSELFAPGKDTLLVYSYMYSLAMNNPCPMCTSIIDSLDGAAPHVSQRVNIVVMAKSPLPRLLTFARNRGWKNLRFLSSADNSYNRLYHGEDEDGKQMPIMNVFVKQGDRVRHFWASELLFTKADKPGQNQRHVDIFWPLWNLLDLTPQGRGKDWYPRIAY
ncbi:MAG TPA: DUF899 family protein [Gammaproteobacteria bacterium]|nr:DUF899 family protein [Gammaproteobacteria bacterium]